MQELLAAFPRWLCALRDESRRYLAVDEARLREVHAASHPRGKASDVKLQRVGGRDAMDGDEMDR